MEWQLEIHGKKFFMEFPNYPVVETGPLTAVGLGSNLWSGN